MRSLLLWSLIGVFVTALCPGPARAQQSDMQWALWRGAYVTAEGRVVDAPNGGISHSEGQGYAMLLAVAHADPSTFARLWAWTRANLQVREDGLLAWRWDPQRSGVTDRNNATDGDILVAWALLRAGMAWNDAGYRDESARLAQSTLDHASAEVAGRTVLLPGIQGFSLPDGGTVINLSYWVFPALQDFKSAFGDDRWGRVLDSGLVLIDQAGAAGRPPPDWIALHADGRLGPAPNQPDVVGYNAYRIPLYLLWAGFSGDPAIRRFHALWTDRTDGMPMVVDAVSGKVVERSLDTGYLGLPDLVSCILGASGFSDPPALRAAESYYPSTLLMLTRVVQRERYPTCAPL
jgi:endoglucanase